MLNRINRVDVSTRCRARAVKNNAGFQGQSWIASALGLALLFAMGAVISCATTINHFFYECNPQIQGSKLLLKANCRNDMPIHHVQENRSARIMTAPSFKLRMIGLNDNVDVTYLTVRKFRLLIRDNPMIDLCYWPTPNG